MVFYYKELFRPSCLKFDPPGIVDENFYLDVKKRMENGDHVTFPSAIRFWRTYWFVLAEFLICFFSACLLMVWYYSGMIGKYSFLFPFLFIVVAVKPTIYFILQMNYYIRYISDESRFHSEFIKAVQHTTDYEEYRIRYSDL